MRPNPISPAEWLRSLPEIARQKYYAEVWQAASARVTGEQSRSDRILVLPDPVDWLQTHFYIPELHGPIVLYDHQKRAMREALRQDSQGLFVYSLVLWSDVKKSAKTTLAGGVAAWIAWHWDRAKIRLVGNDQRQADSRVFNAIVDAIELNPRWKIDCHVTGHRIIFPNDSLIESVPVDPSGEAGGNDDFVSWTELHSAKDRSHVRMWAEMATSPTKFGRSIRWIDTYAGYHNEAPVLQPLYEQLVQDEYRIASDPPMYAYGQSFCMWNCEPRLPWQTKAYYAQQARELLPNDFDRMHRNRWAASLSGFVRPEWWEACRQPLPDLYPDQPIVVALDAAVSGDCFAIVAVSKCNETDTVEIRHVRIWKPVNGQILYSSPNDLDHPDYPEGYIVWLCQTYNVVQVAYDPYQLHDMTTRLRTRLGVWFRAFPQGPDRLKADKELQVRIMEKRIFHDGQPDLAEHIRNAAAKTDGKGLRIVKRDTSQIGGLPTRPVDAAVCASMGSHEISRLHIM